mgnify:CR=1 FL=1
MWVRTLVPVLNVGTGGKGRRMGCVQTSVPLHDCTTNTRLSAMRTIRTSHSGLQERESKKKRVRTRRIAVVRLVLIPQPGCQLMLLFLSTFPFNSFVSLLITKAHHIRHPPSISCTSRELICLSNLYQTRREIGNCHGTRATMVRTSSSGRKGSAVGEPKAWPKEQLLKEAYELHRQRKKALALNPRPRPDSAGSGSGKQSAGANAPAPSLATSRRDSSGTLGDATKQARVHVPATSCRRCRVCRVVSSDACLRGCAGGWGAQASLAAAPLAGETKDTGFKRPAKLQRKLDEIKARHDTTRHTRARA